MLNKQTGWSTVDILNKQHALSSDLSMINLNVNSFMMDSTGRI